VLLRHLLGQQVENQTHARLKAGATKKQNQVYITREPKSQNGNSGLYLEEGL
jgi:hypothetical protein